MGHAIIAAGAVTPLIHLLGCGTAKGRMRIAGTVGLLAAHLPKSDIRGFLPGLVGMLSIESEEVSMEATCAICNIATTCPNREAVMEAGALLPLLHLLSNAS